MAAHPVTGGLGDATRELGGLPATSSVWQPSSRAHADAAELERALAASQDHLGAALREIEAQKCQALHLREQVTQLAQELARARRFVHRDELTGLPNRRLLMDRFDQALVRAARQNKQVALLFLDLNGFKRVNDVLGHAAGDRLLQQVAARLAACIRRSDTASRFGGDEFVVLLPELEGRECARRVEQKIRARLAVPYVVGGTTIKMTVSIGMAIYPDDGREYRDLILASDVAMYRNKNRNRALPGAGHSR